MSLILSNPTIIGMLAIILQVTLQLASQHPLVSDIPESTHTPVMPSCSRHYRGVNLV